MENMDKNNFRKKWPLFILLVPVGIFAFGTLVMLLWNNLLPSIVGVRTISFWEALGLLLLCRMLFGGFNGGGGKHHCRNKGFKEKWTNLSAEEQEQLKEEWKKKLND